MRVSQRLDYALRAVVLLAGRSPGAYLSGTEIAMRLSVPQRVVEQQLTALARAGILTSRPGAGGGHALARPASEISVEQVVRAIQGGVADVPHTKNSATSQMWQEVEAALAGHLRALDVAALARRQAVLDRHAVADYSI